MLYGRDNYAVCLDGNGGIYADQWDDEDSFCNVKDITIPPPPEGSHPGGFRKVARPQRFHAAHIVHLFRGGYVPSDVWKRVLAKAETEMF